MKIFNEEQLNKKVVYIQKKDILEIIKLQKNYPKEFKLLDLDELKDDKFICYENNKIVDYLAELKWIVDFHYYRYFSVKQMKNECEKLKSLIKNYAEEYNKSKNNKSLNDLEKMNYKLNTLLDIYSYKLNDKDLNIPTIPASNGMCYMDDSQYKVSETLDYNKIIFYKKDYTKIDENSKEFIKFFNKAISLITLEKNSTQEIAGNFTIYKKHDKSGKNLIVEIKQNKKDNIKDTIKEKPTTVQKVINIFKKNK